MFRLRGTAQRALRRSTAPRFGHLLDRHSVVPICTQIRRIVNFKKDYESHVAERKKEDIPPLPLSQSQTKRVCELLQSESGESAQWLKHLLVERTPAGVDTAAKEKAAFLAQVAKGETKCEVITPQEATEFLGTMLGGYNVQILIDLLDNEELAPTAVKALSHTLLVFDLFHDVAEKAKNGNKHAQKVMDSWANAEWFTTKAKVISRK